MAENGEHVTNWSRLLIHLLGWGWWQRVVFRYECRYPGVVMVADEEKACKHTFLSICPNWGGDLRKGKSSKKS